MLSRHSHILTFIIVLSIAGCKGAATDPNNNHNTITDIGIVTPHQHWSYTYSKWETDTSGNIKTGTLSGGFALVDTVGLQILGKDKVYLVSDDGDTAYYSYESNSDVSVYFHNP